MLFKEIYIDIYIFHCVSVFCLVFEWANDGSRAAAEVFEGVCVCLRVSVSLI